MSFEAEVEKVLAIEGGYVNDPADSGGATNWGITERTARANGYEGSMRALTRDQAKAIYRAQYWDLIRLDDVASMSERIAGELFDTAINRGQAVGVAALQRSLNVLNIGGVLYADQVVDGLIGPVTLGALRVFLRRRGREGELVMHAALNCLQGAAYIDLAERREKDERFVYGWLLHRVALQMAEGSE